RFGLAGPEILDPEGLLADAEQRADLLRQLRSLGRNRTLQVVRWLGRQRLRRRRRQRSYFLFFGDRLFRRRATRGLLCSRFLDNLFFFFFFFRLDVGFVFIVVVDGIRLACGLLRLRRRLDRRLLTRCFSLRRGHQPLSPPRPRRNDPDQPKEQG